MFTYMYNTDTRYCLCFCSCSYTYSWQLHFQVSGKWSVASKKNLKFEIFLIIINKQIMSILLARTSSRKLKVAKCYVSCWRLKLQLDVLAGVPGIATDELSISYDTVVFILYARQNIVSADMLIKNIVSADIFIKNKTTGVCKCKCTLTCVCFFLLLFTFHVCLYCTCSTCGM